MCALAGSSVESGLPSEELKRTRGVPNVETTYAATDPGPSTESKEMVAESLEPATRRPSQIASSATFSTSGTSFAPRVEATSATSTTGPEETLRTESMSVCGSNRRPLANAISALATSREVRSVGAKECGSLPAGMRVVTCASGATLRARSAMIGVVATMRRPSSWAGAVHPLRPSVAASTRAALRTVSRPSK